MAVTQINLTSFIQTQLAPRLEISSRVWHALLAQKQHCATEDVVALTKKIRDAKQRVDLLQQQFLVILDAAGIKHDITLCVTPDTDREFYLWLAQRNTCVDTPELAELHKLYLVWRYQEVVLMS